MEIMCLETTMASGKRIMAGEKVDVSDKDARYLFSLGKAVIIDEAENMSEDDQDAAEDKMKANMQSSADIDTGKGDSDKKEGK